MESYKILRICFGRSTKFVPDEYFLYFLFYVGVKNDSVVVVIIKYLIVLGVLYIIWPFRRIFCFVFLCFCLDLASKVDRPISKKFILFTTKKLTRYQPFCKFPSIPTKKRKLCPSEGF